MRVRRCAGRCRRLRKALGGAGSRCRATRSRSTRRRLARRRPVPPAARRARAPRRSRCTAATSSQASGCATARVRGLADLRGRDAAAGARRRPGARGRASGPRPEIRGGDRASRAAGSSSTRSQEPAHRLLMELYAWAGDRGAAIEQYRDCVRTLRRRARRRPARGDDRAYEQISAGRSSRRPPQPPAAADACAARRSRFRWSDRDAELASLISAWQAPHPTAASSWSRARPASARRGSSTSSLLGPARRRRDGRRARCTRRRRSSPTPPSPTRCATRSRLGRTRARESRRPGPER